ncbi:hypothetical protein BGC31_07505 [Komagataeibacter xylinus]|nr:hypothetical protein BGC31_07505 [Komagataeibacter xylinus]RFP06557.1 hypothetical protein BFX83_09435 [Komagataeibacter xylinus]
MLANALPLRARFNLSSRPHLGIMFKGMQDGRPECPQAGKTAPVGWFFRLDCWNDTKQSFTDAVDFRIGAGQ